MDDVENVPVFILLCYLFAQPRYFGLIFNIVNWGSFLTLTLFWCRHNYFLSKFIAVELSVVS